MVFSNLYISVFLLAQVVLVSGSEELSIPCCVQVFSGSEKDTEDCVRGVFMNVGRENRPDCSCADIAKCGLEEGSVDVDTCEVGDMLNNGKLVEVDGRYYSCNNGNIEEAKKVKKKEPKSKNDPLNGNVLIICGGAAAICVLAVASVILHRRTKSARNKLANKHETGLKPVKDSADLPDFNDPQYREKYLREQTDFDPFRAASKFGKMSEDAINNDI